MCTGGGRALVVAADGIVSRPIQFAKGASSATVKGSFKGGTTIDYKLRAKAGQTMSVALKTSNGSNYFNVLPPGSNDVAIFVGSTDGNEWTGTLPADGEYTIRVYLMRNAARRNETANYTLTSASPAQPRDKRRRAAPRLQIPWNEPARASSTRRATFLARRPRASRWDRARSALRAGAGDRPQSW